MSHVTRTPLSRSEGQRSMSQGQGDSLRGNRDLASEEGAVGKVRQRSDKSKRV